eukprot:6960915-Pyramimonas_sp.AAC.1
MRKYGDEQCGLRFSVFLLGRNEEHFANSGQEDCFALTGLWSLEVQALANVISVVPRAARFLTNGIVAGH